MSNIPCPKCGAATDLVGSKLVCGECYWVIDSVQSAPAQSKKSAARPSKDPKAPPPNLTPGPAANVLPGKCPKCNGDTTDVGGKLVCDVCYFVFDSTSAPPARGGSTPTVAARGGPTLAQGPPAAVLPGKCPKCNGDTTDVGGKFVCDVCYFVFDPAQPEVTRGGQDSVEKAQSNNAAIGVIIIVVLVVIIVFLMIKH